MKKFLCTLLCLMLVFTMMPMTTGIAFADGHAHDYINGLCECGMHDGSHDGWTNWGDDASEQRLLPDEPGKYYLSHDVIIDGGWTSSAGEVNLCLNGYVIQTNETNYLVVDDNSTLNLYDCNGSLQTHDGYLDETGMWKPDDENAHDGENDERDIIGGIITTKSGTQSAAVGVKDYGILNMYGGTIAGNSCRGVLVNGSFTMNGGAIEGNVSSSNGGGVNIDRGNMSMNGGIIERNVSSAYGGGVNIYQGNMSMTGGEIRNNTAADCGGGIYAGVSNDDESFSMTGGTICGNTSGREGGGVHCYSYGMDRIWLGGSAKIIDNTATSDKVRQNLYISGSDSVVNVNITEPTSDMSIGTSWEDPHENDELSYLEQGKPFIFSDYSSDISDRFFADSDDCDIVYWNGITGNRLCLIKGGFDCCNEKDFYPLSETPEDLPEGIEFVSGFDYAFDGWYTDRTGGEKVVFSTTSDIEIGKRYYAHWRVSETDSPVLTETVYVFSDGVLIGGTKYPNDVISEKLGDYGLTYDDESGAVVCDGAVITAYPQEDYPCPGIAFLESVYTGGIYVGENAKFVLKDGTITGNSSAYNDDTEWNEAYEGGGVYVAADGSLTMTGGKITRNMAYAGGGVYVAADGSFIMTGGEICENFAGKSGGGVAVENGSEFRATGGVITENEAQSTGGGVYMSYSDANEDNNNLACLAAGTPITLADGSRTAIENLKIGDEVRVFDHKTGEISTSKLFVVEKIPAGPDQAFVLHFTDGIDITAVSSHCFFDKEQNKYVSIKRDNAEDFIGHQFYNVDSGCWETLTGVTLLSGTVDTFSIETEKTLNAVANGMLSNGDAMYRVMINIFDFDENLIVDAVQKVADIAQYGLWDFDEAQYATRETYDAMNLQYIKVALGKGLITPEQLSYAGEYQTTHNTELVRSEKMNEKVQETETAKSPLKRILAKIATPFVTTAYADVVTPGVYMGGTIRVIDNTTNGADCNVVMYNADPENPIVNLLTPKDGMLVGVCIENEPYNGKFTTNGTGTDVKYFKSDDDDFIVEYNAGGYLELVAAPPNSYQVAVEPLDHGVIYADPLMQTKGETVTLTVVPDKGYKLKEDTLAVTYASGSNSCDLASGTDNTYTFEMPGESVKVTAEFEEMPLRVTDAFGETATPGNDTYEIKEDGVHVYGDGLVFSGETDKGFVLENNSQRLNLTDIVINHDLTFEMSKYGVTLNMKNAKIKGDVKAKGSAALSISIDDDNVITGEVISEGSLTVYGTPDATLSLKNAEASSLLYLQNLRLENMKEDYDLYTTRTMTPDNPSKPIKLTMKKTAIFPNADDFVINNGKAFRTGETLNIQRPVVCDESNVPFTVQPELTVVYYRLDGSSMTLVEGTPRSAGHYMVVFYMPEDDPNYCGYGQYEFTIRSNYSGTTKTTATVTDAAVKEIVDGVKIRVNSNYLKYNGKYVTEIYTTILDGKEKLEEIKNAGYTVKYDFYRSTEKGKDFKKMYTGKSGKYYNTYGVRGKMYYYRAILTVYNAEGKLVASTKLKECRYANRIYRGYKY